MAVRSEGLRLESLWDGPAPALDPVDVRGGPLPPALAGRFPGELTIPLQPGRPTLIANFVTSLDGIVALGPGESSAGGGEISGFSEADRYMMALLRGLADAVVYFRVVDPVAAVIKVENFLKATALIAQTTLRSVLGQAPLDDLLSQRESINLKLQEIIDRQTEPWGVKVTAVEVKDVALPDTMKRAMAKQAEAERERRAKIVNAEGEFQAAEKMVQAAAMISHEPIALQLRFLQTMREISSEHNTTTFLPVPIDLFSPFLKRHEEKKPD